MFRVKDLARVEGSLAGSLSFRLLLQSLMSSFELLLPSAERHLPLAYTDSRTIDADVLPV